MSPLRRDIDMLIKLSGPAILGRLGSMAMGLTDTVVVGRYSSVELGHMALGWAPTAVVMVTAMGLLNGVAVLTAQRTGEGRPELTGAVFRRGVAHALQFGLLTMLGMLVLSGPMFASAGVSPDLATGAARVMRILAWSMPIQLVASVCSFYLEALGRPARAAAVVWVANGLNLVLDLVLVPGGFGVPALGAEGAALATGLCRVAMLVMLVGLIVGMKDARGLGVFAKPPREPEAERRQRRIGYAAAAAYFVETTAFSGMNLVAAWVGGLVVAGWAIVLNVASLAFMLPLGLSAAASVLVARAHGARDAEGVRRAGILGFGLSVLLSAASSLGVWAFAGPIARAYATDPALVALTAAALGLSSLFMIADALQVVGAQMLRSRGDAWTATAVQVVSYAILMLPLGWLFALPFAWGLNGIVLAALVASLVSASLLVGRFMWLSRRDVVGAPAPAGEAA